MNHLSLLPPQPVTEISPLEGFLARGRIVANYVTNIQQEPIIAIVGAGNSSGSGATALPEDVGVPLCNGYFYACRMRPDGLDAPLVFFTETDSTTGKPYVQLVAGQSVILRWDGNGWKTFEKRPPSPCRPGPTSFSFTNWDVWYNDTIYQNQVACNEAWFDYYDDTPQPAQPTCQQNTAFSYLNFWGFWDDAHLIKITSDNNSYYVDPQAVPPVVQTSFFGLDRTGSHTGGPAKPHITRSYFYFPMTFDKSQVFTTFNFSFNCKPYDPQLNSTFTNFAQVKLRIHNTSFNPVTDIKLNFTDSVNLNNYNTSQQYVWQTFSGTLSVPSFTVPTGCSYYITVYLSDGDNNSEAIESEWHVDSFTGSFS